MRAIDGKKQCSSCRNTKLVEDFSSGKAWVDGLYPWCRACISKKGRRERERDPNGVRAYYREYMRGWRAGQAPERARVRELYLAKMFWQMVRVGELSECWEWTGFVTAEGYGRVNRLGRPHPAHRIAWLLSYGSMPEHVLCHSCDNPPCCNPLHLRDDTNRSNTYEMLLKGRGYAFGNPIKMTPDNVREARRLSSEGVTGKAIAAKFGVGQGTISRILAGKRWGGIV